MSARRKRKPKPAAILEVVPPLSQNADTERVPAMADAPISSSEYDVALPGGGRTRATRTGRWNAEELAEWVRLSVAAAAE